MAKQKTNSQQNKSFHVHLRRTTSQSLAATSETTISGLSVIRNDGYTVSGTSITIPYDGLYDIQANVKLDSTNIRADLTIVGTSATASINQPYEKISAGITEWLTAGTNISISITNNSGAANLSSAQLTVAARAV